MYATVLCLLVCLPAQEGRLKAEPAVEFEYEILLWEVYKDNEAAGDEKVLNKPVEFLMRGTAVKKDGKYVLAGYVLGLPVEQQTHSPNIICQLRFEDQKYASWLMGNQGLKLRGICKGKTEDQSAWRGYRVDVVNCQVLGRYKYREDRYQEEK